MRFRLFQHGRTVRQHLRDEIRHSVEPMLILCTDFADQANGEMSGSMRGLIAAVYWIGGIASLPFVGIINDRFGRRWSIFVGSAIMVVGAIIQGFSVNGMFIPA